MEWNGLFNIRTVIQIKMREWLVNGDELMVGLVGW